MFLESGRNFYSHSVRNTDPHRDITHISKSILFLLWTTQRGRNEHLTVDWKRNRRGRACIYPGQTITQEKKELPWKSYYKGGKIPLLLNLKIITGYQNTAGNESHCITSPLLFTCSLVWTLPRFNSWMSHSITTAGLRPKCSPEIETRNKIWLQWRFVVAGAWRQE